MLSELVPGSRLPADIAVTGITDDSRRVRPGDLYVAVPGMTVDGRSFIRDAIERSAAAVFTESPAPDVSVDVPMIEIDSLREHKGEIASRFYGEPSKSMLVIGVTGTNGKTSCSQFVAEAQTQAGRKSGVVGTMGFGVPGKLEDAGLTTPDAIELQAKLAQLAEMGCEAVCLEASSHGLEQGRLNGTALDVAVFTNITRDHLDYHESFDEYRRAKEILFRWPGLKAAIINLDDEFAGAIRSAVRSDVKVLTYSMERVDADIRCESIAMRQDGFDVDIVTPWGKGKITSRLLGEFNVSNLLSVVGVLGVLDVSLEDAIDQACSISNVPGRMDALRRPGFPVIVVDYAHTPDALEKALVALRAHCEGKLTCLVGCGGDRDRGKRPLMGEIATRLSDRAIFTDDNPRAEDSRVIVQEMLEGVDEPDRVTVETDRARAVRTAVTEAGESDIVLIAGKGHEEYQEINGQRVPYSDYVEVEKLFGEGR
jgi:UDP-N-acetylmuramoyl-L-alanyl-D-glutamate--2,6-diaminopimelate ligase